MNTAALDSLLHWLVRTSLEASVLILAVLGLRALLGPRLSPAWRIGLWMIVGLKLLLPACIPAGFGLGHWWVTKTEAITATQSMQVAAPVTETASAAMPPALPLAKHRDFDVATAGLAWAGLWLAGAVMVLAAAVRRQRLFEKQLGVRALAGDPRLLHLVARLSALTGVRQQVQVVMMPAGTTPAVVGCSNARLLLPEDWDVRFDEAGLRHVLLHELQHVRQRDLVWNWIALAVQALHWFNPLVWLVGSRFQADRELRCDACALALLSPNERLAYGHTLLRVQETFFAPPAIAGLAPCVRSHPSLRQRIRMITQPTHQRPWFHTLFAVCFGLITCYAFTTVSAVEKEVPAKDRSREGSRGSGTDENTRETPAPRGGEGTMKQGGQEGGKRKTAERDGMRQNSAEADGTPRTGLRDGERPKTAERDGARAKTGVRDGARAKTGVRDGEKAPAGERDGERPKSGDRDGNKPADGGGAAEAIVVRVTDGGDTVVVAGEKVPVNRLRGYLQTFLAGKGSAKVTVTGDTGVTSKALYGVMDAVRDNGAKDVRIQFAAAKE